MGEERGSTPSSGHDWRALVEVWIHGRLPLAAWPTPVHDLPRLGNAVRALGHLVIKRDDQATFGFGGTKVRQLEMIAGTSVRAGATALVCLGSDSSNCVRLTSLLASALRMRCVAVIHGAVGAPESANISIARHAGAEIVRVTSAEQRESTVDGIVEALRADGERPFKVPLSERSPRGCLAVAAGYGELVAQVGPPDVIVVCSSTGATQAGLMLGAELLRAKTRIVGVTPDDPHELVAVRVQGAWKEAMDVLRKGGLLSDVQNSDLPVAEVRPRPAESVVRSAIDLLVRTEGVQVDPCYSGVAAAEALRLSQSDGGRVVFWHTGGLAAMPSLSSQP